jgi:hypothetical protein
MKKVVLGVLVMGLAVGIGAGPAFAQEKNAGFSLNLGVQTNVWGSMGAIGGSAFDNAWFTLDARMGFRLGKSVQISPELMYMVDDGFDLDSSIFYPGVILNYKPGNFFIGAGVVLPISVGFGTVDSGNPAPKINIGYQFGSLIFTLYALTWTESGLDFLDMNFVGLTLGYRF